MAKVQQFTLALAAAALAACSVPPALPEAPTIALSRDALSFQLPTDGSSRPAEQSIVIRNAGPGTLAVPVPSIVLAAYQSPVGAPGGWLEAAVVADPEGYRLRVQPAVRSGDCFLPEGRYLATVVLDVPGAANSPRTVQVTLTVPLPVVAPLPAQIAFQAPLDGSDPPAQRLSLRSWGGLPSPALQVRVVGSSPWLSLEQVDAPVPYGGVDLIVHASASGVPAGEHLAVVEVSAPGSSARPGQVKVALRVQPPWIGLGAGYSLTFRAIRGDRDGIWSPIENYGGLTLQVTEVRVDPPGGWLSAELGPPPGTCGVLPCLWLRVEARSAGLAPGTHTATITLVAPGAGNSPLAIPVQFEVLPPHLQLSAPSVSFRTPASGGDPAPVTLLASEAGGGRMEPPATSISYASGVDWLSAEAWTLGPPYPITLKARIAGLASGLYRAEVRVTPPGGDPVALPVELLVEDWVTTSSVDHSPVGHASLSLPDGRALVVGGRGTAVAPIPTPEPWLYDFSDSRTSLYDPLLDAWTAGPSLAIARYEHTATLLQDGGVLVAGGVLQEGIPGFEFYSRHETVGSFEVLLAATGSLTGGALQVPRSGHTATLLGDGRVLVAGGALDASAEIIDPTQGSTLTGSMMVDRRFASAVLLPSGKVLVAGGIRLGEVLDSAELYDPVTGTWSATGSMTRPGARNLVALPDGRVLGVGGSFAEVYDPTTGSWAAVSSPAPLLQVASAARLPSGDVLAVGVTEGGQTAAARYHPALDSWSGLSAPHDQRAALLVLASGRPLLVGGDRVPPLTAEVFRGALP